MTVADPIAIPRHERGAGAAPAPRPAGEALALADGVELLGEYEGSGFRDPPLLARRADGQMIQLSRLLYLVAAACDGQRDAESVAVVITEQYGRRVSVRNVCHIVDRKLRPLGVLALADGTTPSLPKREPVMALRQRKPIVSERYVNAVARAFVWLHRPVVQIVVLASLAAFDAWLFGVHGIAGGLRAVLYSPVLLLGVLASIVVATAFHEFGHASACRYGGARPGVVGVGLYLVWPAFYCDITESYRLNRSARLRTDLGGIYFNGIFALLAGLAYFRTGQEALLLVAFVQHTIVLQQLLPMLRFDGYYVLSDLTGVPDILSRVGPIFRSLVPHRPAEPRVQELKPWVRVVVTAYLLVLIPALMFMIGSTVVAAPRMAATAFDSIGLQVHRLGTAHATPQLILGLVQICSLLLPLGAVAVSVSRCGRMAARAIGSWSRDSAPRRAIAIAGTAALAASLAHAWWPNGDYRPIRPGERGTIGDALRGLTAAPGKRPSLTLQREALLRSAPAARPQDTTRAGGGSARHPSASASVPPARTAPAPGAPPASGPGGRPGVVTRPPAASSSPSRRLPASTATASTAPPPGPVAGTPTAPDAASPPSTPPTDGTSPPATDSGGDGTNMAVATNTTDGARMVRIAFDLAWIDANTVNATNAAIAVASCNSCTTVAIAMQALVIFGQPRVFMPTNLAVSLNQSCTDCQTLASAYQDVIQLSASAHLSAAGTARIAAIRQALAALAESGLSIVEIQQRADALHRALVATLSTELVPDDASSPLQAPASSAGPTGVTPSGAPTPDGTSSTSPPAVDNTGAGPSTAQPSATPAPAGDASATGSADAAGTGSTTDPALPAGTATTTTPAPDPTTSTTSTTTDPTTSTTTDPTATTTTPTTTTPTTTTPTTTTTTP